MKDFYRVLPDDDPKGEPGWRLHVYRSNGDLIWLSEEQVLPEKVTDVNANRVIVSHRLSLSIEGLRWLRDQFNEILADEVGSADDESVP